jgi:hypothetical protein
MSTFTRVIWHEQIVMRWNDMWGGEDGKGGIFAMYRASYEQIGRDIDAIPGYVRQMMKDMVSNNGNYEPTPLQNVANGDGSSNSNNNNNQGVMPEGWRAKMANGDVLRAGEFMGPNRMGDKDAGALLKLRMNGDLVLYTKNGYKEMVDFATKDLEMTKEVVRPFGARVDRGNPEDWASAVWKTNTRTTRPEPFLQFTNDGDLVLYDMENEGQEKLWSSQTGEGNASGIRSAKGGSVSVSQMWDKPALVVSDKDGKAIMACVDDGCHVLPHGDVEGGRGFKHPETPKNLDDLGFKF